MGRRATLRAGDWVTDIQLVDDDRPTSPWTRDQTWAAEAGESPHGRVAIRAWSDRNAIDAGQVHLDHDGDTLEAEAPGYALPRIDDLLDLVTVDAR